ncbi:hypothetical protein [Robiginitalea aurantiaca]|uniref:DUF4136 domain-containing protein n=1 Tax=Robiginitalea aurantiaca TaxID=3056915 RepID=A0ABT7WCM3_9FLAO|nr:hypothetical protein [Robiginitalea aurantiaca]MDM9630667.1 hypothetical protein [Robiginitalea aurantiaca]
MRKFLIFMTLVAFSFQSCSTVKVLNTWSAEDDVVASFREKNVLVIARTNENTARTAFESEIAKQMRSTGMKATESFKKIPTLHTEVEMSEERLNKILSMIETEGFNGIVITTVKDTEQVTQTNTSGVYAGVGYGGYPGYYGGFNSYYGSPYAYGPYYSGFGGYMPTSSTTTTYNNYVLETVGYSLDEPEDKQLVFVVTSKLSDPTDAYKTAEEYVGKIVKAYAK